MNDQTTPTEQQGSENGSGEVTGVLVFVRPSKTGDLSIGLELVGDQDLLGAPVLLELGVKVARSRLGLP